MITCFKNAEGKYVHVYYNEIICWEGFHILHAVMTIVISLLFIVISLIVTLTFYEAKGFNSVAGSR